MSAKRYSPGRLLSFLSALDPGGIRLARGVLIALAVTLAGYIGYGVHVTFSIASVPNLVIFAAGVAGHSLLFTPPASRREEFLAILLLGGVAQGLFLLAIALSGVNTQFHALPFQGLWVLIIALIFFMRRFGPRSERTGLFIALIWLLIAVVAPDTQDAFWLPVAGLVGTACAVFARCVLWRPSAMTAFDRIQKRYGRQLADTLAGLTVRDNAARMKDLIGALRFTRRELVLATEAARHEHPDLGPLFDAVLNRTFRQILAVGVSAEVIGSLSDDLLQELQGDSHFLQLVATLRKAAEKGAFVSDIDDLSRSVDRVRSDLFRQENLSQLDRLSLLRLLFSLRRLALLLRPPGTPESEPELVQTTNAGARRALAPFPYWKLSVQGLVAASITTALGWMFQLSHAYWATLTVMIVLSGSLGQTRKKIFDRAVGTALGVSVALLLQLAIDGSPFVQYGLILFCLIWIFVAIERNYLIAAGLIGFSVVTALHLFDGVTTAGMAARIYETFIGAGIAFVAAWLVFPIKSDDKVQIGLISLLADSRSILDPEGPSGQAAIETLRKLHADTADFARSLRLFQNERLTFVSENFRGQEFATQVNVFVLYVGAFVQARSVARKASLRIEQRRMADDLMRTLMQMIDACLNGRAVPDLSRELVLWSKNLETDTEDDLEIAADLVSLLYFGRKIADCLTDLSESAAWRTIFERKGMIAGGRSTWSAAHEG